MDYPQLPPIPPPLPTGGWTFYSMPVDRPLYVVMFPPGGGEPIPLPLAGLSAESRRQLDTMRRGDLVPESVVAECLTLAPRSVLPKN